MSINHTNIVQAYQAYFHFERDFAWGLIPQEICRRFVMTVWQPVSSNKNWYQDQVYTVTPKPTISWAISSESALSNWTLKEKLQEHLACSNIKAVCTQLQHAEISGMLEEGNFMHIFPSDLSSNLLRRSHGKCYNESVRLFFEALLYIGWPCIVRYVAVNFNGPDIHSMHLWHSRTAAASQEMHWRTIL